MIIKKYLKFVENTDEKTEAFIERQINRMPSHYHFGLVAACTVFYIFRLQPSRANLMEKFFLSLHTIKFFEDEL